MKRVIPAPSNPFWKALGLFVVNIIRRRFASGGSPLSWPPPKLRPGGQPLMVSGRLMRSVGSIRRVESSAPSRTTLVIGTNDKRAALMHFGGVVRPVHAKALFIPLTAKGRRVGPTSALNRAVSERMVVAAYKAGDLRKANRLDKRLPEQGIDFVLKQSVTIPARPFLFLSAEDRVQVYDFVRTELRNRLAS